jgi:hypothetical protein
MARLRRYRRTYFRKADTVATLTLVEDRIGVGSAIST